MIQLILCDTCVVGELIIHHYMKGKKQYGTDRYSSNR